jgi:hypothetical protein
MTAAGAHSGPAVRLAARAGPVDAMLLAGLTSVLCARPLISESFIRALPSFLSSLDIQSGATPLATVWLDGLLLSLAVIVWVIHPPGRIGWGGIGIGLLAIAVGVSCAAASEKRLAINAGSNLLSTIVAGAALTTLISRTGLARLVLCVVIAVACVNATKCIQQKTYEFQDTLEAWRQQKQRLAEQGHDLTAPRLVDYERRLQSAEAFGYLSHPNVTAACLNLALIPALAVLVGCILRRPWKAAPPVVAAMIVALLSLGVFLTGSSAGWLSAVCGCALVLVYCVIRARVAIGARTLFALGCGGYLAIVTALVAFGLVRGTLPGASLAFRWQYWTATRQVIADTPLTGTGRENFLNGYLLHKDSTSTEEIRNPHNLWLGLLAELGPTGLVAGVILACVALRGGLRTPGKRGPPAGPQPQWAWAAGGTFVMLPLVQAVFSGTPFAVEGIAILWAAEFLAVFVAAFAFAAIITAQTQGNPATHSVVAIGIATGVLANLAHNLVGFSIFTPAGIATLVALAACGAAWCLPAVTGRAPDWRSRTACAAIGVFAIAAHSSLALVPATLSQRLLDRTQAATSLRQLIAAADDAVEADRFDSSVPAILARTLAPLGLDPAREDVYRIAAIEAAERLARVARDRDPESHASYRLQARVAEERANILADSTDVASVSRALREAANYWEQAIERHPTQVRDRIEAAELRRRLWILEHRSDDAAAAREHVSVALEIDRSRQEGQAAKLRETELARIAAIQRHVDEPN